MSITNIEVFNQYAYSAMIETTQQQIDLFNAASAGTIVLSSGSNTGSFSEEAMFGKIAGLVRRRNPFGAGAVTTKTLTHIVDRSVKVASGTAPLDISPAHFRWLNLNPEVAGAAFGQSLARDTLADMVNTAIGAVGAAISGGIGTNFDATALVPDTVTPLNLNSAAALFGDSAQDIRAWIIHGTPMHNLYANGLQNAQQLFTYGTVNVLRDFMGRIYVVTDSPNLVTVGAPNIYATLGLTTGAVEVTQNGDFDSQIVSVNGQENLQRTIQAEWSTQLSVKGHAWDKASGGQAPADAALFTSTNWDRFVSDLKQGPGVRLLSN